MNLSSQIWAEAAETAAEEMLAGRHPVERAAVEENAAALGVEVSAETLSEIVGSPINRKMERVLKPIHERLRSRTEFLANASGYATALAGEAAERTRFLDSPECARLRAERESEREQARHSEIAVESEWQKKHRPVYDCHGRDTNG